MVKKFCFRIPRQSYVDTAASVVQQQSHLNNRPRLRNHELHEVLKRYKEQITQHYRSKKWDRYKKFANEYELVFTSCHGFPSIADYVPISRSYFKMWEFLCDFEEEFDVTSKEPKTCMFLAEGPGGFVEAFANMRRRVTVSRCDQLYGVTLKSDDKHIPQWKQQSVGLCHVLYGADGTGNLCNLENIRHIVKEVGARSADVVTADGGFDFSVDFNSQEDVSLALILSETVCAISLQKPGGCFVLKIYDMFNEQTLELIHLLSCLYNVHVVKPLTSRPANSEKYLVCTGFQPCDHTIHRLESRLQSVLLRHVYQPHVPFHFYQNLVSFNTLFIMKQMTSIAKTLAYIHTNVVNDRELFRQKVRHQVAKAIRWCHKYHVPISLNVIRDYGRYLSAANTDMRV